MSDTYRSAHRSFFSRNDDIVPAGWEGHALRGMFRLQSDSAPLWIASYGMAVGIDTDGLTVFIEASHLTSSLPLFMRLSKQLVEAEEANKENANHWNGNQECVSVGLQYGQGNAFLLALRPRDMCLQREPGRFTT